MAPGFNLDRIPSPSWWVNALTQCAAAELLQLLEKFSLSGASRDEDWKLGEGWQIRM